jgi:hypothetical protein
VVKAICVWRIKLTSCPKLSGDRKVMLGLVACNYVRHVPYTIGNLDSIEYANR